MQENHPPAHPDVERENDDAGSEERTARADAGDELLKEEQEGDSEEGDGNDQNPQVCSGDGEAAGDDEGYADEVRDRGGGATGGSIGERTGPAALKGRFCVFAGLRGVGAGPLVVRQQRYRAKVESGDGPDGLHRGLVLPKAATVDVVEGDHGADHPYGDK